MPRKIHILGICGTFMGSLALLAKAKGYLVEGSDEHVYPPMSTQLQEQGIRLIEGYDANTLRHPPDLVVVGNAMKRGNPAVEMMLNTELPYCSGPEFLANEILRGKHVMAIAGTHGKTTTSSMLAWILEEAGLAPGFLIGGIPNNFGVSARLGEGAYFVIEADEYDTAFFDKRSKFIHYHPRTLILNNLEFDHADIFNDVADIQKQFHHLIRTVPSSGVIIDNATDPLLQAAIAKGCWTPRISLQGKDSPWQARLLSASTFAVYHDGDHVAECTWTQLGEHNVHNALSALVAAMQVGVSLSEGLAALSRFTGVKRRLECRGVVNQVTVYDDFAHHPTAIATTIHGLRKKVGRERIIAVLEFASNTMKMGVHQATLVAALGQADEVYCLQPKGVDLTTLFHERKYHVLPSVDALVTAIMQQARPTDHVLVMSNRSFDGIHERLLDALGNAIVSEQR